MSGGQQQRLCIARALATSPTVLLLDEPTASLDPLSTQRIEELVYELRADVTIIIVTHNMQQAARISDKTAFMLNGELVEFTGDEHDVHRAERSALRGVRDRTVRVSAIMAEPSREVVPTEANRGLVEAENFSFWYGEKQALHGITLSSGRVPSRRSSGRRGAENRRSSAPSTA